MPVSSTEPLENVPGALGRARAKGIPVIHVRIFDLPRRIREERGGRDRTIEGGFR